MIRYVQGNLLDSRAEALVNTVNEVGVMGKGVALAIRDAFPDAAREYMEASRRGEVRVGSVLATRSGGFTGDRWILHFPTKRHWRHPSRIEWVRDGLRDLLRVIRREGIRTIALPPLGCGNGGLDWASVRAEIETVLGGMDDLEVEVFEPSNAYFNAPKRTGVESLTPARALVAELVRQYGIPGIDCSVLEIQKLAYLLQRVVGASNLPDPLDLQFNANRYGPYSDRLRHLLDALDGSFLHCDRRLSEAKPGDPIWFDFGRTDSLKEYLASEAGVYQKALRGCLDLIRGFESPFGMELLTTVDWLVAKEGAEARIGSVERALRNWPAGPAAARRKLGIFKPEHLELAIERIRDSILGRSG